MIFRLPWKIQKSHFSTVLLMRISEENKLQLLYCSLAVYLLLCTQVYLLVFIYLLPVICIVLLLHL